MYSFYESRCSNRGLFPLKNYIQCVIENMCHCAHSPIPLARGGYTVHPVPAPLSTILLVRRRDRDGGSNQNLMLFIRGNAMSGAPSINGTSQFPNPPIMIGMSMKKIITKAWAVTIDRCCAVHMRQSPGSFRHRSVVRVQEEKTQTRYSSSVPCRYGFQFCKRRIA
jgi:hypothetical protein